MEYLFGKPPFIVCKHAGDDRGDVGIRFSYKADEWALLDIYLGLFIITIGWWPYATKFVEQLPKSKT